MNYGPFRNDDAPEISAFAERVEAWLDLCPFPLYDNDRARLRDLSESNTAPDGDE